MKRGEVWWVMFEAAVGGEVRKERPAVIVSNDIGNEHLNRVQVVPLTMNVDRVFPGEAIVTLKGDKRKALATQLATVAKARLSNMEGKPSAGDMRRVENAIKVQLGLV